MTCKDSSQKDRQKAFEYLKTSNFTTEKNANLNHIEILFLMYQLSKNSEAEQPTLLAAGKQELYVHDLCQGKFDNS